MCGLLAYQIFEMHSRSMLLDPASCRLRGDVRFRFARHVGRNTGLSRAEWRPNHRVAVRPLERACAARLNFARLATRPALVILLLRCQMSRSVCDAAQLTTVRARPWFATEKGSQGRPKTYGDVN